MVNVETKGLLDGQFTKIFKDLYIKTSCKPLPKELTYPLDLKPYLDMLYKYTNNGEYVLNGMKTKLKHYNNFNEHDERVLCAFSGGKDSVADVLLLKSLGYKPILFFVKGVNRSYPQELETSKILAEYLGMELIVYSTKISGKCDFVENPTKNQFILALMVDYGVKLGISNYSFGAFIEDEIEIMSSDYMLSDAKEMFDTIEGFYSHYINGFQLLNFLHNEAESYYIICNYDKKILDYTYSCMTPLRYKQNLIKNNERKYGIKLITNRCGSCHKCAIEAIVLSKMGVIEYSDQFLKHCEEVLEKIDEKQISSIENKKLANSMDWYDSYFIDKYRKEHK